MQGGARVAARLAWDQEVGGSTPLTLTCRPSCLGWCTPAKRVAPGGVEITGGRNSTHFAGLAQLEARLVYTQEVGGSMPSSRTMGPNRHRSTEDGPSSEPGEADDLRQIPVGKPINANVDIEYAQELAVA